MHSNANETPLHILINSCFTETLMVRSRRLQSGCETKEILSVLHIHPIISDLTSALRNILLLTD